MVELGSINFRRRTTGARLWLSLAALVLLAHCTPEQELSNRRSSSDAAALETLTSVKDEHGDPIASVGFEPNREIVDDQRVSVVDIVGSKAEETKVFEFKEPAGFTAVYSNASLIKAATSTSSSDTTQEPGKVEKVDCSKQQYSPTEPSLADILKFTQEHDVCGEIEFNFCIRVTSDNDAALGADLKTPTFRLNAVCAQEAFAGAEFFINENAAATKDLAVDLSTSVSSHVEAMYITNTAGCASGGSWEPIASLKSGWRLESSNAENVVYVAFRDKFSHISACFSDRIEHDDTPPEAAAVSIDNGASSTGSLNVALSLVAVGASEVYVSEVPGCLTGGQWETFSSNKAFSLTQVGESLSVYAKYRDTLHNESACVSDTILYNDGALGGESVVVGGGAGSVQTTSILLEFTGTHAREMYVTNTPDCVAGGSWQDFAPSLNWVLGQSNGIATVYVKFKDARGREGTCLSDSVLHDDQGPAGVSLLINAAAAKTATAAVDLTLAASDAAEMYVTNVAGCASGGVWESFATHRSWALGQSNTTATVYVKLRDNTGNATACFSDTIMHDDQGPTASALSIDAGSSGTASQSVMLGLTASGASEMYVSNTATCASGGSWEPYASSKAWTLAQSNGLAQVYVQFRDDVGNLSSCVSDDILHDDLAPSAGSISIDAGVSATANAAVALSLDATGASSMYVTNTAGCTSGGSWEAYATSKAWNLAQTEATATVYVAYRDALGNTSICYSDSIVHDATPPSAPTLSIDSGTLATANTAVTLTLAATDASTMYITDVAGCTSGGTWESFATSKAWTLAQTNATATVYVAYRDALANTTSCVSDSIVHDTTAPTGTAISIDGGSVYASSTSVNLGLTATDASEMYITNTAGCASGGTWVAFAASYAWTLGQTDATATVYAQFKDALGNTSACIDDTIIHDGQAPTGGSISIEAAATHTATTSVTLTIGATGATEMYVTDTAGCGSGGTWEAFATSRAWTLAQTNTTVSVHVKFKNGAGNISSCATDSIVHDTIAPTTPSLSINSASTYATTTAVTLATVATGASHMYVTDTAGCASGGSWEAYAATRAWTLAQTNASATVYVKYRDEALNTTSCLSDTIIHDDQGPSATSISINAAAAYTTSTSATLTLAATDAAQMYISNTAGCGSGGSWETYATSKAWTLGQSNATATVYIKYRDVAGNESSCLDDTIIHDNTIPSSTSISIAAAAAYTTTDSITLTLAATGASEMYVTNTAACGAGGSWEAYATSKAWTLGQTNATASVYVKYRDAALNESACISDTIIHDNTVPASTSISIAAGATYATSTSVTLTLAATSASDMYITNTAACGSGGSWEAYATSKAWTLGQTNGTATVYVKYRDAATNESACISDTITHDTTAPSSTSISIAAGATYATSTSVTLTLAATAASDMYITNTAACGSGGSWETYATSKAWTLAQTNGTATVYVKYRDAALNESSCASDTITHDSTVPASTSISIDAAATYATTTSVTLTLAATGASDMYVTNTAACGAGGSWETYATSKAWTLGQTNGTATVYVKYRDAATNESACISDTITHDNTVPASTSISIAAGATYATSTSVTLTLAATGASDMYVTNTAACGSGGSWETYATSKAWTLGQTNATATVYVKYRDAALNESSCISDTITHDSTAPTSTSISIAAGATYATSTSVTLTLAATGASDMYVTNTAACGSGGSWETYATSKAWTLGQSNATATVYIKYRDGALNESSCISDTITHDSTAPTSTSISIAAGATYATSTSVTLTLAATGASDMYITNTAACGSGGSWETYGTSKAWTLGQSNATATVYVKFRDAATNESACTSDTITHDDTAPTSTSLSISSAAAYTTSTTVSLGLAATGAADMYITNTAGCASGGSWITYATSYSPWTIAQTNATATVYVKFRDGATNTSSCISDTIVHDSVAPTAPTGLDDGIWAASATSSPSFTWTLSTDSGSGVSYYQAAVGTTAGNTDIADWASIGNSSPASRNISGSFTAGVTYYTTLRAFDNAGNVSAAANGNGFVYGWHQEAYIKAANAAAGDKFGSAIAIDGDTLVVAADREDSNQSTITNGSAVTDNNVAGNSGAVYVYKRSAVSWAQQAYIKASNAFDSDIFGTSVAISGETMAVGAYSEDRDQTTITNGTGSDSDDHNAVDSGAVYVYQRNGTTWAQQAYIKAINREASDNLGIKMALFGDTLAASAPYEDSNQTTITNGTSASADNSLSSSGAVYVYKRTGTTWAQQAYIKPVNSKSNGSFGRDSMSLYQDTLVVGSQLDGSSQAGITNGTTAATDTTAASAGAAWVYRRTGTVWAQEAYLKAINSEAGDDYGRGASVFEDTIAVGAPQEDSGQTTVTNGTTAATDGTSGAAGAVYIYNRTGTTWAQQAYLKPGKEHNGQNFGAGVSLTTNTIAVAATYDVSNSTTIVNGSIANDADGGAFYGAAHVFKRSAAAWSQVAYLKPPNARSGEGFGFSMAISGDTIAVSSLDESSAVTTITNGTTASADTSAAGAGAVYIFRD